MKTTHLFHGVVVIFVTATLVGLPLDAHAAATIVNGDFSATNTGFASAYEFVADPNTSVTPGTYAVRTNPQSFNPGLASFGDHTSGTGFMMVVDGSSPSAAVWAETFSVTPNTLYNFSAWATPTFGANLPILRFEIDNSVTLGPDFNLGSNVGQWQNFAASWNSGAASTATLSFYDVNPTPLVDGDDFAVDDISFTAVPEPFVMPLALATLAGVMLVQQRRTVKRTKRSGIGER